jgi:t-SNARE complex subunit (syntaxin)
VLLFYDSLQNTEMYFSRTTTSIMQQSYVQLSDNQDRIEQFRQIEQIKTDVQLLNDMFVDIHELIQQQGEVLETLESNMISTKDNALH